MSVAPARSLAVAAACVLVPTAVFAHGGEAHAPGWIFDPLVCALLALSILAYWLGLSRMKPRARRAIAPPWRVASYVAAILILIAALLSPFDAHADTSFAWHMGQHLLLMLGAAPLLALSNAHLVSLNAFSLGWRRRLGRFVGGVPGVKAGARPAAPWAAALAFAAGLWLWHAPSMYDAALGDGTIHTLEHLTFLLTAAIFWRMVAGAGARRLDFGSSILLVTLVGLQGNLLAALITLAPTPIYGAYASAGIYDQQIAGLLMWIPAGLLYLGASTWALVRMIGAEPARKVSPASQV